MAPPTLCDTGLSCPEGGQAGLSSWGLEPTGRSGEPRSTPTAPTRRPHGHAASRRRTLAMLLVSAPCQFLACATLIPSTVRIPHERLRAQYPSTHFPQMWRWVARVLTSLTFTVEPHRPSLCWTLRGASGPTRFASDSGWHTRALSMHLTVHIAGFMRGEKRVAHAPRLIVHMGSSEWLSSHS